MKFVRFGTFGPVRVTTTRIPAVVMTPTQQRAAPQPEEAFRLLDSAGNQLFDSAGNALFVRG